MVPASLGAPAASAAAGVAAGIAAHIAVGIAADIAAGIAVGTAEGAAEAVPGTQLLVEHMASPAVEQHQDMVAWSMAAGSKGPAAWCCCC